jgi:hypothetical protein
MSVARFRWLTAIRIAAVMATPQLSAHAASQLVTCPEQMPQGLVTLRSPGDGWVAAIDFPRHLSNMLLFRGPPSERYWLRPASESKTSDEEVDKYRFADAADEKPLWVQCTFYGETLSLSHPIEGHPHLCVGHYMKDTGDLLLSATMRCE